MDLSRLITMRWLHVLLATATVVYTVVLIVGGQALIVHALGVPERARPVTLTALAAAGTGAALLGVRYAVRRWVASQWYSLERAATEDARQILEEADRDPVAATLLHAEVAELEELLERPDEPITRDWLTAVLTGFIDHITDPGWSGPPPVSVYSPARLRIAALCHMARVRGFL